MKLLIVSDTHSLNTKKLLEIIKIENADINIHAGDYMIPITEMKKYFQYFVDGNNDSGHEREIKFTCDGIKFLLTHGDSYFGFDYEE
jgi:putative phosphoesterase